MGAPWLHMEGTITIPKPLDVFNHRKDEVKRD